MRGEWKTRLLGDVCRVIGGGTPSKGRPEFYGGTIPWATVGDMQFEMLSSTVSRITEDAVGKSATNVIPAGSVVIATRVGLGKVCMLGQDTAINQDLRGIIPLNRSQVSERYLFWWFKSIADCIVAEGTGATVQGVKVPFVKALSVPVPPPAEQQRIVGILDEAFEGIATAKANAEENVRNAHALFESHLQFVFTQRGEGWVERRLGDVCSIARGGSPRPIKAFLTSDPSGINWIKIRDATASGKYIYATAEKITCDGVKRSRMVNDGDFLLSNSMSFGRPYIMRTSGCIHDGWLVLSDYDSQLDQDFLYYLLGSQLMFQQFDHLAAGSTVRNLNIDLASRVDIPLPPLEQQRLIAQQADVMSSDTACLESIYQRKLAALDELKASLLHQAFSGDL